MIITSVYSLKLLNFADIDFRANILQINQSPFGFAFSLTCDSTFVLSIIMNYMFFLINGRSLIKILDSSILFTLYPNNRKHKIIGILLISLIFVYSILSFIKISFRGNLSKIDYILIFYTILVYNTLQFSTSFIVHFFKHATHGIIFNLYKRLKNKQITDRSCLEKLRTLANINRQFNRIIGLSLLIYVFRNSVYCVYIIFRIYHKRFKFYHLTTVISYFLHSIYLLYLDIRIQKDLMRIIEKLRLRNNSKQISPIILEDIRYSTLQTLKLYLFSNNGMFTMHQIEQIRSLLDCYLQPLVRRDIKYFEMIDIYKECFYFNVYDMFLFDGKTFFSSIAIVFVYILLIIQSHINFFP